ncbi:MAG: hypothetical protein WC225_02690 [Acholeplasmataceae bacterium]|nr:hypothetical protein [Acholeplasmataceae bacterium]
MDLFNSDFFTYLLLVFSGAALFYYITRSLKKTLITFIILYIFMFAISLGPLLFDLEGKTTVIQGLIALSFVFIVLLVSQLLLTTVFKTQQIFKCPTKNKIIETKRLLLKQGQFALYSLLALIFLGLGFFFSIVQFDIWQLILAITNYLMFLWGSIQIYMLWQIHSEKIIYCVDEKCFEIEVAHSMVHTFIEKTKINAMVTVIDKTMKQKEVHYFMDLPQETKGKEISLKYESLLDEILLSNTIYFLVYIFDEKAEVIKINN